MSIAFPEAQLQVYTSPKVLSTSLRYLAFHLENGYEFTPFTVFGRVIHIHRLMPALTFDRIKPIDGFTRLAFIRDPIARFISMYCNRVQRKHPQSQHQWEAAEQIGLPSMPDINYLIKHLEKYRENIIEVRHHSAPQVEFIGSDLAYFDQVFTPETIGDFEALLSERLGRSVTVPHEQGSGEKGDIRVSTRSHRLLRKFYSTDTALYKQAVR